MCITHAPDMPDQPFCKSSEAEKQNVCFNLICVLVFNQTLTTWQTNVALVQASTNCALTRITTQIVGYQCLMFRIRWLVPLSVLPVELTSCNATYNVEKVSLHIQLSRNVVVQSSRQLLIELDKKTHTKNHDSLTVSELFSKKCYNCSQPASLTF